VAERVMEKADIIKSWEGEGGASDHLPILLHIMKDENKPLGPFKFKPKWMVNEDFKSLDSGQSILEKV